jgi:hypothetical protein
VRPASRRLAWLAVFDQLRAELKQDGSFVVLSLGKEVTLDLDLESVSHSPQPPGPVPPQWRLMSLSVMQYDRSSAHRHPPLRRSPLLPAGWN